MPSTDPVATDLSRALAEPGGRPRAPRLRHSPHADSPWWSRPRALEAPEPRHRAPYRPAIAAAITWALIGTAASAASAADTTPPVTVDDVPATYRVSPITVSLTASDDQTPPDGLVTQYSTGVVPGPIGPLSPIYSAAAKPTLANGERISYASTDASGNTEATRTSRPAIVADTTTHWASETLGPTESGTGFHAVADVNGDGRPDIVGASWVSGAATVIERNDDDTGWNAPTVIAGIDRNVDGLVVTDVTGDGRPDIVSSVRVTGDIRVVARNTAGTGWEAAENAATVDSGARSMAVGDLTGDGRPDIAVADRATGTVSVIARDTTHDGWNAPATAGTAGGKPKAVAIADTTGDGKPDIVVANSADDSVSVISRNAAGTGWDPATTLGPLSGDPQTLAVADVTGDGHPDIVTSTLDDHSVSVISRSAAGTGWDRPQRIATVGRGPYALAVADINGDGRTDIVTAEFHASTVSVILRSADGQSWKAPKAIPIDARNPESLTTSDMNGDGRPDLVVANTPAARMTVLTALHDGVAPVTSDDVPIGYRDAPVTVTLTATDEPGGSGLAATHYTTGTNPPAPTTASTRYDPLDKPVLRDGEAIRYFSVDEAGNTEAVRTSVSAQVDEHVPTTTITAGPADPGSDARPSVAFADSGHETTFTCTLDDDAFAPCVSPFRPNQDLADGPHRLRVRGTSRAGVTEPTPAEITFVVDTVAPDAPELLAGPPAASSATTVSIAFATEPGATATCRFDGRPADACTSPLTLRDVAVGNHQVLVTATDAAGNTGPALRAGFTITAEPERPPVEPERPVGEPDRPVVESVPPRIDLGSGVGRDAAGRAPTVLHDGTTTVECLAGSGHLQRCTVVARSTRSLTLRSGKRLAKGTVLARGTSATGVAPSSPLAVGMRLTDSGRSALTNRPLGVTARATVTASTTSGATVHRSTVMRLMRDDTLTLRLPLRRTTGITAGNRRMLARLARTVGNARTVECAAHADAGHPTAGARAVTRSQARQACRYLRKRGLDARQTVRGHGATKPRASNRTAKGRARNRRLEITIRY